MSLLDFTQPINPGWFTVTINEGNSSAPETEKRILASESYGRQIGQLMDAVAWLVEHTPELKADKCGEQLLGTKREIDDIKAKMRERRQARLVSDLLALKRRDKGQFDAVIKLAQVD